MPDPGKGQIRLRQFPDAAAWISALADAVAPVIRGAENKPVGLLWPGGRTPRALAAEILRRGVRGGRALHLLLTDERMVPALSRHANQRLLRRLARGLGIPEDRILTVDTTRTRAQAAAAYDARLRDFLVRGGRLPLGLLGLGSDGHTASLFTLRDARRRDGLAIPVARAADWDRVSVTAALLARVQRVIVVAAGRAKAGAVQQLQVAPEDCPAGVALQGAPHVDLWWTPLLSRTPAPRTPASPAHGQAARPPSPSRDNPGFQPR